MAPALAYTDYHLEGDISPEITVSEYIYRRILQLGIKSVFGVPGDFVLDFCEEIKKAPDLNWVGTCNELNGSYAADAYGKISGKIGVFVSTFGVGELSALNGVAGAFAEFSPLLHIVGTSSRAQKQSEGRKIHHLIQKRNSRTPNHKVYESMVGDVSIVQESLCDPDLAAQQIDNAIEQVYQNSRPGYVFLPSDMATVYISSQRLGRPLELELKDANPQITEHVAQMVLQKLYAARNPCMIVNYLCRPFRQQGQLEALCRVLQDKVNLFTTPLSKGFVDESHTRFAGIYAGDQSPSRASAHAIENSDFVLDIGSFDVQNNNGNFTAQYQPGALVEANEYMCCIEGVEYECHFTHLLRALISKIDAGQVTEAVPVAKTLSETRHTAPDMNSPLTQDFLAAELEKFLRPNDILVVETCSFLFTIPDLRIPDKLRILTQNFYNSIGYALPATIGASLANRELGYREEDSRVILVQGDGSALMTLQELTTYMRQDIKATILLLNNDGYTVERVILGENSLYNDIPPNVQWTKLFHALGDVDGDRTANYTVETRLQLAKLFNNQQYSSGSRLQMVELILDRMDAPDRFRQMVGKLPGAH